MKLVSSTGTKVVVPTYFNAVTRSQRLRASIKTGHNADPTGEARQSNRYVGPRHCDGDLVNPEGIPFTYRSGHGGRGWAIRSTVC